MPERRLILHIDDDMPSHKIFKTVLGFRFENEFEVHTADDLEEALGLLESHRYDYVFLDNRLTPYRSAVETLPKLLPLCPDSMVYVISASTDETFLRGVDAFPIAGVIDKFDLLKQMETGLIA